jgi:hypothetical protein
MAKNKEKDLQKEIADLIDWDDFRENIKKIENPISKVNVYLGILPYVLPKLQSVSQDITTTQKDAMGQLLESLSAIDKD